MQAFMLIGLGLAVLAAALSTIPRRPASPPPAPIFIIRADPVERTPNSDTGAGLLVLLLVIGLAIWLL